MKLLFIVGTRPEAIKLAPVILKAKERDLDVEVIMTGQHIDLVIEVFEVFGIENYRMFSNNPANVDNLSTLTTKVISNIAWWMNGHIGVLESTKIADVVVVQGDTVSTFVGALLGFYHNIPVAHVEAGLRSGNTDHPFPEEMFRRLTAQIASYHFCPIETNKQNLFYENIDPKICYVVGNTVIDALNMVVEPIYQFRYEKIRKVMQNSKRNPIVMTIHRRESWDMLEHIFGGVKDAVKDTDVDVIFPVHPNPIVKSKAEKVFNDVENVHLLPPIDYLEFINLLARSSFVVTDSGGVQEEAPYLGKPVMVVRRETERPEIIKEGFGELVNVLPYKIKDKIKELLYKDDIVFPEKKHKYVYGEGDASKKILDILQRKGKYK